MSTARILSENVSLPGNPKNIEEAACGEEDNPSRLICFTYFGKIVVERRHVRRESNEVEDCPNGKTAISSEIHIQNYLLQNNINITLDFVAIEDLALTHNYAFFLALKPSVRVYRFRFDHIYGYNSQLYCLTFEDSQEKPLKVDEVIDDVAIGSNCTKGQRHFHIVDAVISVERMKPSSTAHRTHLEKTSSNSSNSIHTPSGLSAPPVHETTSEPATVSDDSANRPSRIPVLSACSPSPSSLEPSGDLPSERIASVPDHSRQKTPAYPKEIAPELSHCQENQLLVIEELKIKKFNKSAIPRALLCCTDACCYLALNSRADAPSLWCIFDETQHWNESNGSSETVHVLQIGTSQAIVQMKAGRAHVLLLNAEGEVFSFGTGTRGELGHGSLGSEQMPKQVDALVVLRVVQIDCGAWHSVALTQDGDVYVWGWNNCGQLTVAGDCLETEEKSTKIISVPEPLDLEPAIASISAYRNATLLKRADNHEIIVLGRMDYDIESCH